MTYSTDSYELIDVRRIWGNGRSAQIAVRRQAYSPDRLYAWTGRHTSPNREWHQDSLENKSEFRGRVRREIAS